MERDDVRRVVRLLGDFPGAKTEQLARAVGQMRRRENGASDADLVLFMLGEMAGVTTGPRDASTG